MNVLELIRSNVKNKDFTSLHNQFIDQPENIDELIKVATSDLKHPFPEYASWLVVHISKNAAHLLKPFQPLIIDRILTSTNQSVLRNLLCTSQQIGRTTYKEGELLDYLLGAVINENNKVALQVYALYSLIPFMKDYPELKTELDAILQLKVEPIKHAMKVAIRNFHRSTLEN